MTTFVQLKVKKEPRTEVRSIESSDNAAETRTVDGSSVAAADDASSDSGVGNTGVTEQQNAGSLHSNDRDTTNLMQGTNGDEPEHTKTQETIGHATRRAAAT